MPGLSAASDQAHRLDGQVAVITGATSGIGRAIALELAAAGADIVVHGRRREKGEEVVSLVQALGRQAHLLLGDLTDVGFGDALVEQAWEWRKGVDIWVNNAGADVLTGAAAQASFDQKLEQLWRLDVRATIQLSRLVGSRMLHRDISGPSGVILNLGWDQAEQGMAGDSGEMFSCIKGAVMAFTRSLAQSLAPRVRVNCLAPGWIKTSWGQGASEYWQSRASRESLRQRWGTPEDVARAARFLATPAADFITGQIIPVNGGFRYGT